MKSASPDGLKRASTNRRAFTLLELIIVVLMSAILMSLLLPILARSSDQGTRAVCVKNLRQLGSALLMYGADNNDLMAYPNWGTSGAGWLYDTTSTIPDPTAALYTTNVAAAYRPGLWFTYVRNPKSYLCPVDLESRYYRQRANKLCSYVMNGAVCGYGSFPTRTPKLTDIWSPRCYLLWNPDENVNGLGAFAFNDASSFPDKNEGPGCLHTVNGTDLLTVGGSVQFATLQKFRAEQNSAGLSLAWWSPFTTNGH
jgi:prepilin-type N-terminal cleavage/methylation domain-containing protein